MCGNSQAMAKSLSSIFLSGSRAERKLVASVPKRGQLSNNVKDIANSSRCITRIKVTNFYSDVCA
jgi:hypothetical protein